MKAEWKSVLEGNGHSVRRDSRVVCSQLQYSATGRVGDAASKLAVIRKEQ